MVLENYTANANMMKDINEAIASAEYFMNYYSSPILFSRKEETGYNTSYGTTALNLTNNWYQAVHGYRTWDSCSVSRSGEKYIMEMEYSMRDFYDWNPNNTNDAPIVSQFQMYTLHCARMAKQYKVVGQMKIRINWAQGQTIGNGATYNII